jgi:GNAT superfamily N-acetyltransferase
MIDQEHRLSRHLRSWLGTWPPSRRLVVVGSDRRVLPGWDGAVHPLVGIAAPEGIVLSVPPDRVAVVEQLAPDPADPSWEARLESAMARPGMVLGLGIFRAAAAVPLLPAVGEWVPADDPVVPAWLHPFGGEVLIARAADGRYAAGLGLKRHDGIGREISVGTGPAHRGRGLGRRLVATAARRVLERGLIPTYLHDPGNTASAAVAEAAGFPDRGWRVIGMWPQTADDGA